MVLSGGVIFLNVRTYVRAVPVPEESILYVLAYGGIQGELWQPTFCNGWPVTYSERNAGYKDMDFLKRISFRIPSGHVIVPNWQSPSHIAWHWLAVDIISCGAIVFLLAAILEGFIGKRYKEEALSA